MRQSVAQDLCSSACNRCTTDFYSFSRTSSWRSRPPSPVHSSRTFNWDKAEAGVAFLSQHGGVVLTRPCFQVDNWMQRGSEAAVSTADATLQSAQEAVSETASAASVSCGPLPRSLAFINKGGRAVVEPFVGSSSLPQAANLATEPTVSSIDGSAALTAVPALPETTASSPPESLANVPEVTYMAWLL